MPGPPLRPLVLLSRSPYAIKIESFENIDIPMNLPLYRMRNAIVIA